MCDGLPKMEDQLSSMSRQTEIVQAEFHVTKYVATFTEKTSISVPADARQGSSGLQSELVDGAINHISGSLPAEVMRVTRLQRHQESHISTLQGELAQLQEQKRKAMAKCAETQEEIDGVTRRTLLAEEECRRKNKRCIELKNEILTLGKDCEEKRRLLTTRTSELQALKIQVGKYRQTQEDYSASIVSTNTGDSKVQAEIQQVEDRLVKLREKRDFLRQNPEEARRVCDGSKERELEEKVAQLTTESSRRQEEVKQLQEKVEAIRAKQEQVKQATEVLKKRNAAQLIRLKRQVKEQQLRHRQWTEQRRLLKQTVATFTQRLQSA